MPSCPRCGVEAAETARFCSACGAPLGGAHGRPVHARKIVTVMFADVVRFTSLSERIDAESLQLVMHRFVAEMRQIIVRHGGTIEKLMGDAIMAVFGVPVIHEDDAARAARCALEMQAALAALNDDDFESRWGERLRIHIGINTGEVMVGPGDDGQTVVYGDVVNVAKRLQEAAEGEIIVGPLSARLIDDAGRLTPLAAMRLKGKGAPVDAWRLRPADDELPSPPGPTRALVGRREELAALRAIFDRVVQAGTPATVTITGVAGIGKSRLVGELLDDIGDRAAVVAGRCLPYGEGITYWPIAEIVRRLAGRPEVSAIEEIAGGDREAPTIAHHVARVVGMAPGTVAVEEAHWALRRLLEIRAADRPLVVVLDDIHWAEPTLLDLLDHLSTLVRDVPLLLVYLARPELLERAPDAITGAPGTVLALGPLPDEDAAALLEELTAGSGVAPPDDERVLATAEGNPFFLEQIVAMRAGGDEGTPASIQALLAARIDALPPSERDVVDRAAVEGRWFHRSAVSELLPASERAGLDRALEGLARRQLIRPGAGELPGEAGYRFVHILVRDVVYELLPKAARADLHERYAAWLEERAGPRFGELVGYHLEQAHRWHAELRPRAVAERRPLADQAARRLSAAAHAALQRGDLPGGVNLLRRAAELLSPDAPARAPVLPELALALVQLGELPQADQILSEAIRNARERGDELAEAHARTAQFFVLVQVEPDAAPGAISTRFDALHRTFADASDDLGLARLHRAQAFVHWLLGRSAKAASAWKRAVRHSRMAGDEQGAADGLVWQASAAALGPRPVPLAIADCRAIVDQLGSDRRSQALAMRPLASLHAMAGEFDIAHRLLAESSAIHAELGVSLHAVLAQDEAYVALIEGDAAAAEAALRPCVAKLGDMGEKALLATMAGVLARALVQQGRDDEAWAFTDLVDDAAAPDDLSAQMLRRIVRAQLLARRGDARAADRLSRDAVTIIMRTDWLVEHAEALMARGEILRAAGRDDEAAQAFDEAVELFRRKGNVVSAERARAVAGESPAGRRPTRRFRLEAGASRPAARRTKRR